MAVPKTDAQLREDEILKLVCAALSDDRRQLTIVGRPDRDETVRELTVDALIRVETPGYAGLWAADVCLASRKFDPRLPAAMADLEAQLRPPLEAMAEKVGHYLTVSCPPLLRHPNIPRSEWKALVQAFQRNLFDRVAVALVRPDHEWYDSEVGIKWQEAEVGPDGRRVGIHFSDPYPNESFRFSRAVPTKLNKQLRRAHEAGYPTLLILDQKGPSYVRWISNSAPEPAVIGEGLAFLVGHHRATLTAAVLVNCDNSVHEVYGVIDDPSVCRSCRRPMLPTAPAGAPSALEVIDAEEIDDETA